MLGLEDLPDDDCIEHVWRARAFDFTPLGAFEERYCTRCGVEDLILAEY